MTDAQTLAFILGVIPIIGLAAVYLIHLIRHGNVDDNHSQPGGQIVQLRAELADVRAERDALRRIVRHWHESRQEALESDN